MGIAALVVLSAVGLVACGGSSASLDSGEAANIRILNQTGERIDRLWLGVGPEVGSTFLTRYNGIDDGETTGYQTIEPIVENYGAVDLVIDGERYLGRRLDPHGMLGVEGLSAGSYYTFTFVLDSEGIAALSEVTLDEG